MRDDGFGYRARVGLVYIASSVVMEPECYAMAPYGVSIHTARVHLEEVTVEGLSRLGSEHKSQIMDATRLLSKAPLQSIVFGCTSGSFVGGPGYDLQLVAEMAEVSGGIPVTTTTTAATHALRTLGVRRIALFTPYPRPLGDRAAAYFEQLGHPVVVADHLGIDDDREIGEVPPDLVYRRALALGQAQVDGVLISCTNLRTLAILEDLERDLGKPVVSAIQASFWKALRLAGVRDSIGDCGRLFRCDEEEPKRDSDEQRGGSSA
jgi:maleate isomerase